MKFLTNITQVSSCPSPSWAYPCDVQDIPEPFHRLSFPYSMHHSQQPKSDDPNTFCQGQEIPFGEDGRNVPSTSSQDCLRSRKEDIQHACEYDPCSQHPSIYGHSTNRRSVPVNLDSDVEGHRSKLYNDISSPILYDNLNYLLNGSSYDIRPSNKTKIFIETKVAAIELQGFNH